MLIKKAKYVCHPDRSCTDRGDRGNESYIPWLCSCGWRSDPNFETIAQMIRHYEFLRWDEDFQGWVKIFFEGQDRTNFNDGNPPIIHRGNIRENL